MNSRKACSDSSLKLPSRSWRKHSSSLLILIIILAQALSFVSVSGILLNWTFEGKVPTDSASNSVPSIAEAPDSTLWMVWQSLPPIPATIPKILLKTYHFPSQVWSNDLTVTLGTESDTAPDVTRLANDTMMVVWSRGNSSPFSNSYINYKLNTGTSWSPEIRLTSGPVKDLSPAVFQDRSGLIWLVWERRLPETVVYDSNGNGVYDSGETVISGPSPTFGVSLKDDFRIKYHDANDSIFWETGEALVHDTDNDSLYDAGEPLLTIPGPPTSTLLVDDPKVKYVDKNNTNSWEFGPSDIYSRLYDGSTWSNELQLTTDAQFDQRPSITQTRDGRIWMVWSSNRNNRQSDIFFKTFDGPTWSADTPLFSDTDSSCQPDYILGCPDDDPDIVQDRDGSIRIIWTRLLPTPSASYLGEIFTRESTDNGSTFPTASQQRLTSNNEADGSPAVAKFNDTRLRLFWTRPSSGLPGVVDILYMKSDPIFTHDIAVTSVIPAAVTVWNTTYQVSVTIINQGDFPESATITLMVGGSAVGTLSTSTITVGGTATVTFTVRYDNTTLTPPGRHPVTAEASISVEPAGNLPDNNMTTGTLTVLLPPGDMDHDGDVELVDAVLWTQSYGSTPGSPSWNPEADLNGNGAVDLEDATLFARWIGIRI